MTDREKQIAFLLATSQYLIPAWECTYEEAAKDLVANGVTVQKHGRWEENQHDSYDNLREEYVRWFTYVCSACGGEAMSDYNFCPNCGARMDGE